MRNLRRAIGAGLVCGVVVVSMAAASGSALSVDGGTLQVFTIAGGPPLPRGLVLLPECRPLTVPCPDDESLEGSPSPSPLESPASTLPPDGTGGGTPPVDPGGDPPADRASLLRPCRDRADCVIYTIRAGDNLVSIVRFFDVAMDETEALNRWLETAPHLPVGVELRLPWPEWLPGRPVQVQPDPTPPHTSPEPTPGDPSPDPTPADPPADPGPSPDPTPGPTESPPPTDTPDPTAAPTSDPPESPSPPGP